MWNMASAGDNCDCCWPRNTLGTRGFSCAQREFSVLAKDWHIFDRRVTIMTWQKLETVLVSGTQGSPEKKLRKIIFKKIPWKGSSKIEANHLPKKARISLNVCKQEDVSSTNTTKILIMIIMKSRNADLHTSTQGHFYYRRTLGRYTIVGWCNSFVTFTQNLRIINLW